MITKKILCLIKICYCSRTYKQLVGIKTKCNYGILIMTDHITFAKNNYNIIIARQYIIITCSLTSMKKINHCRLWPPPSPLLPPIINSIIRYSQVHLQWKCSYIVQMIFIYTNSLKYISGLVMMKSGYEEKISCLLKISS